MARAWATTRSETRLRLCYAAVLLLMVGIAGSGAPASSRGAEPLRLERVVVLMRHGVRPPTKNPPMPAGTTPERWPEWPVAPGYLTPHGAAAVRLLGEADRAWFANAGLLPRSGCPAAGAVALHSDSDQRTIATGDAYLDGLARGCGIANRHAPQEQPDPLFATAGEGEAPFDPARADAAVMQALGRRGIAGAEADERGALLRLDRILCGDVAVSCGVNATATRVVPAAPGQRPKLAGALDRGSTAAQILLLEYAEGKPMAEVGWGRVTAADVTALSSLHATEFALLARPPYLAARNGAPIARAMLAALTNSSVAAPHLTLLAGHDTNVASIGGLLDLHWSVPGFARDDPPPGGAIVLERVRDAQGRRYVRASFRAQTLEQLRKLAPLGRGAGPARMPMTIGGCPALCPLDRFLTIVDVRLTVAGKG